MYPKNVSKSGKKPVLFSHKDDLEQYQSIFQTVENSQYSKTLNIPIPINQIIAEYATGKLVNCPTKHCNIKINILKEHFVTRRCNLRTNPCPVVKHIRDNNVEHIDDNHFFSRRVSCNIHKYNEHLSCGITTNQFCPYHIKYMTNWLCKDHENFERYTFTEQPKIEYKKALNILLCDGEITYPNFVCGTLFCDGVVQIFDKEKQKWLHCRYANHFDRTEKIIIFCCERKVGNRYRCLTFPRNDIKINITNKKNQ